MEFKGTAGKWYHDEGTISIWHPTIIGKRIACVDNIVFEMSEEDEANARLISKAPEMLEMLNEANKVIEWYMENAKPDDNHTDFFNIGINQRTQIEKLINSATEI